MCEDMKRQESRGGVTSVPRREFNQNPDDFNFLLTISSEIVFSTNDLLKNEQGSSIQE
jgi:hypothetical protein